MMKRGFLSIAMTLALAGAAVAQTDPKASYDELCLTCHKQPRRIAARIERSDAARAKLDAFLLKHYAPDANKRTAVIDYLFKLK